MNSKRNSIYLAALLHDIGKFYQRADKRLNDKRNELSFYSKQLAENICKINPHGGYGYQHVIWTNEFFDRHDNIFKSFPELNQNLYSNNENDDSLANFATNHHNPMTQLQAIVTMADWWSAGIDRRNANKFDNDINWTNERYKKIPLYSIFNNINIQPNHQYNSAFLLNELDIKENACMPISVKDVQDGNSEDKYKLLWDKFIEDFDRLPTDDINGFSESLLYLLKKYTWCIPSNTMDMSNVSLYEHLKTTAAFADCFYRYMEIYPDDLLYNKENRIINIKEDIQPVMLVGGDLSGIQKFIYDISSKGASLSLKGRSFYLQLIIDSVIQKIISHKDIGARLSNVVYSSGGKFFMLLPNIPSVKEAISQMIKEIETSIWEEHKGTLAIGLDYVPFKYNCKKRNIDFEDKKDKQINDLWKRLSEKLTIAKNRKFKDVIVDKFDEMFVPIECNGGEKICAVTGIESSECKKGKEAYYLPIVIKQLSIGKTLKDADYIFTYRNTQNNNYLDNRSKCNVNIFNVQNYLFDKDELTYTDAEFRKILSADLCRVKWINNTNFLAANKIRGQKVSYGFQFYGGNEQAKKADGSLKTFEELVHESGTEKSDEYLGILRMDVDNLGAIFINGLSDENKSFASYSTLSFMLDYFFSGYLNTIRNNDEYRDFVNIIYSGGDDIFAVGRWNKLILFAQDIRKEFAKFIGRDDISISGGIAIIKPSFPISKAAQMAGNAEDKAKTNVGKNALNIFGENVSWDKDFDYVVEWKKSFKDNCEKHEMPKSILQHVMLYAKNAAESKTGKDKNNLYYIWHIVYYFSRQIESAKNNILLYNFYKNLQNEMLMDKNNKVNEKLRLLSIAARWAELELKNNNQNN